MQIDRSESDLDSRVEKLFISAIESPELEELTSDEVTIVTARLAARFATYAGDAANW